MKIITCILLTIACFFSCGAKDNAVKVDDMGSSVEGCETIVQANNEFTFDLYSRLSKENADKNIFFSPYSILVALTMTYEGAKGKTAEEMQSVLHIPKAVNIRRPNFARIYNEINEEDAEYMLSTANALWAQRDFKFLAEYTNAIEKFYGGKVTNLDFIGATEESRQTINTWVEDHTNQKIKDLIPQGALSAATRLVLTNAIYFKGTWVLQFDENETLEEDFRTGAGKTVKVPMMRLIGPDVQFKYAETEELQILELPYEGEDLAMFILLPKEDDISGVEASIDPKSLLTWQSLLIEQQVHIFIPKFKFTTKYMMVKILSEMGMPTAFSDAADFSGMNGAGGLCISNVIHQAFVEVNEEGTEAAAATAAIVEVTSAQPKPPVPVFRADHPFIFIIQDIETGNILFLGRVCNPS